MMNTEKQIKALAELDGLSKHKKTFNRDGAECLHCGISWHLAKGNCERNTKHGDYTSSYDAIIPLLRKQPESVLHKVADAMDIMTTPSQLCEALLRATGKWEE